MNISANSKKNSKLFKGVIWELYVCLTWKRGIAWDLREMGSAWRRGVKGGPAPQKAGKISSQCSARKEATWRRKRKEGGVGRDEEVPALT
jgi:hypothetical protein